MLLACNSAPETEATEAPFALTDQASGVLGLISDASSSKETAVTEEDNTGNSSISNTAYDDTKQSLEKSGLTEQDAKNKAEDDKTRADLAPSVPKLIKTGYLTIEVQDYKKCRKNIADLVSKYGGYLGTESESNETYRISNDLVIRIPFKAFEQIMSGLMAEGIRTDSKQIEVKDVGEEFADLQARIIAKLAVEKRYLAILAQASKIKDILEVEEKLRVIREETEAAQGRVKFLESQVSFSTINLKFYQTIDSHYVPPSGPGFFSRILKGFVKGWEGLLEIFIAIAYFWPLWIIILLIIIFLRRRPFKLRIWPFRKS